MMAGADASGVTHGQHGRKIDLIVARSKGTSRHRTNYVHEIEETAAITCGQSITIFFSYDLIKAWLLLDDKQVPQQLQVDCSRPCLCSTQDLPDILPTEKEKKRKRKRKKRRLHLV